MPVKVHLPMPVQLNGAAVQAVLILFSLPDCAYCEKVRAQSLRFIERDARYRQRVNVFEVDFSDNRKKFAWFDGKPHTGKSIAAALGVKFAPTVLAFSQQGKPAGEPLMGSGIPDFYNAYVDDLILKAWALSAG